MKVVEGALTPLREVGVRILNYLDDWLILAQSREQLGDTRDLVLRHLSQLGLWVNWEKSKLSPVQRISFLGVEFDSVSMTARLTEERAQAVLNCLSSFRGRNVVPLKQFQRLLGHMASAAAVTPLGLLHMRPLQHWLHSRVPRWARVATPSRDDPADLELIRGSSGRPVCLPRVLPLPAVLLPDRGPPQHRCTGTQLASGLTKVCVFPSERDRTDTVQAQGGRGAGPAGCTPLAHPDLVYRTHFPRDSTSLAHSSKKGPPLSPS